jgi:glycosyltransferase involved in cell wall biosynthesis
MRYFVSVSRSLGERFCEYNSLSHAKLRVVPYGADVTAVEQVSLETAMACRRSFGFEADSVVVGSVGRLVEQKDYPTQLKAFALAAARVPTLRMVIAGEGPLAADIRRMIGELELLDRVRLIGHREDVPVLLKGLDVFVLASKFEPYGVALLEAKAAGLPVVATRVNEVPEIVRDGETGLLSPAGDAEAMARSFVQLACDPALRTCLGQRALADARARHSLEASVRAYHELYESALN